MLDELLHEFQGRSLVVGLDSLVCLVASNWREGQELALDVQGQFAFDDSDHLRPEPDCDQPLHQIREDLLRTAIMWFCHCRRGGVGYSPQSWARLLLDLASTSRSLKKELRGDCMKDASSLMTGLLIWQISDSSLSGGRIALVPFAGS